jgi:hypothetical protein
MARSRLGYGKCGTEEGRVHPGIHSVLLQQKEWHPGGQRQVNNHVLQEWTQGLILDPQAHHKESKEVKRDKELVHSD